MTWRIDLSRAVKGCLAWILLVTGMMAGPSVQAETIMVVLSEDSAPYQEVLDAVRGAVGNEHNVTRQFAEQAAAAESGGSPGLIITVGVRAAESVARSYPGIPVIAALVPRDWFLHGGQNQLAAAQRAVSAVFLDQPFSRQIRLIKETLPQASRLGVVLSATQSWQLHELRSLARSTRFSLSEAILGPNQRLVESLDKVLREADLLLALPDPDVFNRSTAQTLFLTTYRYRVPVVGYSKSLTRAGALVSIYSTPFQIGRHAGEMALKALTGNTPKLAPAQFPKYYSIATNTHVARSLGIDLPDEASLLKRVQDGDERD